MTKITKKELKEFDYLYNWEGKIINFNTGKLAPQADGSIILKFGDNVLLFTAVLNKRPDEDKDFTPLIIDFRESYSAAGKIGGGMFHKREGRPSKNAILYSRLTDRALRPLFPKGMINDIVISITPLSIDKTQDLGTMCIIGSSLAIMHGGIPFNGPVGAVRIGYLNGQYIINPTEEEIKIGKLNLIVAGPKGLTNMIEVDAKEVEDEIINEAFKIGQNHINNIIQEQEKYLKTLNIRPKQIKTNIPSDELFSEIKKILTDSKLEEMMGNSKLGFNELYYKYEDEVLDLLKNKIDDKDYIDFTTTKIKIGIFTIIKKYLRNRTLTTGKRFDNRDMDTVRPLYCEVGSLPRTHGSGLFRRGDTQVLNSVTLGSVGEYQLIDSMESDSEEERYIHHYNFPPFSTNEARGTRGPGRREIGHGALAEKALIHLIPSKEEFPYTIRSVSDCLASGGSTSQASICASTLALMDAGVPIKAPVSGIAMGLMSKHDNNGNIIDYKILTDLAGTEDFTGDMDFKVAGTKKGITAIQLDTKIPGLPYKIIVETIKKAHTARNAILDFMLETISKPRKTLSEYAPKIFSFKIDPKKIKEVIGRGGEIIDNIIEKSGGVKIDFEDNGNVFISDKDQKKIEKAVKLIKEITEDLPLKTPLDATITRIENYGFFVSLVGGKSGLVGARTLGIVGDLNKHFKIGQKIKVEITNIDDKGRLVLKKI